MNNNQTKQLPLTNSYFWSLLFGSLAICLALLSIRITIPVYADLVSELSQDFEEIIHVLLLILSFKIFKEGSQSDKKIFFWLIITNIFFFLNDFVFYVIIYLPIRNSSFITNYDSLTNLILNDVPFTVWLIALVIFLSKILIRDILPIKLFVKILLFLTLINIVIILLYIQPVDFYLSRISVLHNSFLILSNLVELIIFDLAILCLIYSRNSGISMLLTGFILVISGDFLVTYCRLANVAEYYGYGSLLWLFGMFFILLGLIYIYRNKDYAIRNWFRTNTGIKSRVTFWSFLIASSSFLFFFIVARWFSILNAEAFIGLPLFIMLYSVVVVCLSVYMGHVFETPFRQIENNIQLVLRDDNNKVDDRFFIDEFVFLQNFLVQAFKEREEQDQIRKKLGDLLASVAHDIGSPMNAMDIAIYNLKKSNADKTNIGLLEASMQSVKSIAKNLLNRYRNINENNVEADTIVIDDGVNERYIILSMFIVKIVTNKQLEWSNKPCKISFTEDRFNRLYWAYISPVEFSRMLSNLLNNAYESINKEDGEIKLSLSVTNNNFELSIQDNGIGITADKIVEVLAGKSLKHPGNGLGLSGAQKYLNSLNGQLCLTSEINSGTTITVSIPVAKQPSWSFFEIKYSYQSIFVVLDDDPAIMMLWQNILMPILSVPCKYYTKVNEFRDWYNHQEQKDQIILLVDYDLRDDKLNGIDVIEEFGINHAYMFTNHAEDAWLQKLVNEKSLKLSPKSLIDSIIFTLL